MTFATEAARQGRRPVAVLEIDLPQCAEVHGVAPCTAVAASGLECYNTLATCQDRPNYNGTDTVTVALCSDHVPPALLDALPCIRSVSITPARIELAGLALRASAVVTCQTFPHNDVGFDPYHDTRPYTAFDQGNFFAKLKARWPTYKGAAVRLIERYLDDTGTMEREFLLDRIDGPDASGRVQIRLRDVLSMIDGKAIKLPPARDGVLSGAMNSTTTTLTVSAGDAGAYQNATHLRVQDEIMTLTTWAAGGSFTVVRDVAGTSNDGHASGETVHEVYHFDDSPVDVIRDTLVDEAGVPSAMITDADWNDERDDYLPNHDAVGYIVDPTGVDEIIGKLCKENAIALWHDELAGELRLKVISQFRPTDATVTDDDIVAKSWRLTDELGKRVSRVITNFAPLDYSKRNEKNNYARTDVVQLVSDFDDDAELVINSDLLESGEIAEVQTTAGRYVTQWGGLPQTATFAVDARDGSIEPGNVIEIVSDNIQGPDGLAETRRFFVIQARPLAVADRYQITAVRYAEEPASDGGVFVTVSTPLLNVYEFLGQPTASDDFIIVIPDGVTVYSNVAGEPALDTGALPVGSTVEIQLAGDIIGYGGAGGAGGLAFAEYETGIWTLSDGPGEDGSDATDAVNMTVDTTFKVTTGNIWGGGGGGGGSDGEAIGINGDIGSGEAYGGGGGGGGAGFASVAGGAGGVAEMASGTNLPEVDGTAGQTGTTSAGTGGETDPGHGASGGDGSAHGAAGSASSDGNAGGAAGKAVDLNGNTDTWSGTSLATLQAAGQVKGAVS